MSRRDNFMAVIMKTCPSIRSLSDKQLNEEVQNCLEIGDGEIHPGKFDVDLIPENRLDELFREFDRIYRSWVDSISEEARDRGDY